MVLLFLEPGGTAPLPPAWYDDYFFRSGVGAYWTKQSNGNCWLEGDVFGWYTFSQTPDFNDPWSIIYAAQDQANLTLGPRPSLEPGGGPFPYIQVSYDVCIIFLARVGNAGLPPRVVSCQQPRQTSSVNQRLASYVILDTNSSFDVIAHEIGHSFNFSHSFDDTDSQYESWPTKGGEYGHPYCIMSAETYGNRKNPVWTSPGPLPNALQRIGPNLNGMDAVLGFGGDAQSPAGVSKVEWSIGDPDRAVELESLGSWPGPYPKVLRIHGPKTILP